MKTEMKMKINTGLRPGISDLLVAATSLRIDTCSLQLMRTQRVTTSCPRILLVGWVGLSTPRPRSQPLSSCRKPAAPGILYLARTALADGIIWLWHRGRGLS